MSDPVLGGHVASNTTAAKTAGWLVLSRVLLAASAAAAGLIAAAVLGPSGRGEVAIGLLLGYMGAVAGILGLENSLVSVAPGRRFAESYGLAISFAMRSLPVAATVSIVAAAAGQSQGWYRWDSPFAVLGVAVGTGAVRLASTAGAAAGDSRRQTRIAMISGVALVIGAIVLGVRDHGESADWLWLYSISTLLGVAGARLPRRRADDHDARMRDLRAATLPALAATATNFLTLRADRLLLPLLTDTTQLGVYVVASTMVDVVALPAKSASQVLVARWRIQGPPRLLPTVAVSFLASAIPAALLVVFGRSFFPRVLGSSYAESGDLLLILGPAITCYLATRAVHARQLALGNQWAVSNSETAGFVVAIATYLVAIPLMGAQGAALGSLLGYATSLAVGVFLSVRTERRPTSKTPMSSTTGDNLSSERIT